MAGRMEESDMTSKAHLKLALGFVAFGALAACQPKADAPVDTAKAAADITAASQTLIGAFNAKDADKAVSFDMDDYVGMMHGQPNIVGKAKDLEITKLQIADPAAKVEVSDSQVDVAKGGDMAVQRMTYAYTFTDPKTKSPTTERGNWVLGWKAQPDGSWKLAWTVISDTTPSDE